MELVLLTPTDNIMYSTSTSSATILTSTCATSAVYEPLKDGELKCAQAQAVYETPQASGAQNINKKPVRIHTCTHKVHTVQY